MANPAEQTSSVADEGAAPGVRPPEAAGTEPPVSPEVAAALLDPPAAAPVPAPLPVPAPAPAPAPAVTEPAVVGLGIGTQLRAGRERAGFTLIQAAERLHMEPRMVEALEAEAFDLLGAPVYVRGHLKRYAELLAMPAQDMLQRYAGTLAPAAAPDLRQIPQAERPAAESRQLGGPIAIALVLVAGAGVLWWAFSSARRAAPMLATPAVIAPTGSAGAPAMGPGAEAAAGEPDAAALAAASAARAAGPAIGAEPPSAAAAGARPAAAASPPAAPSSRGVPAAVAAAPAPPAAATAPPAPAAASAPPPAARTTELRLDFTTDSWTEVYDADGKRLYYDIAPANTEQTLRGRAPLRVVLGHAPGVSIAVNGRSAAIPARARRDEGAEFVVNRAGRLAASP